MRTLMSEIIRITTPTALLLALAPMVLLMWWNRYGPTAWNSGKHRIRGRHRPGLRLGYRSQSVPEIFHRLQLGHTVQHHA